MKLNTIVPPILKDQIQDTLDHLDKLPQDERRTNNFNKLIQAWLSRHPVTIQYQGLYGEKPELRTVETYFIEPSARNRANYVIGYCRQRKSICTFIMDRIIGDIKIENDVYEIPPDFTIYDYLGSSWGGFADEKVETVKLRFSKRISHAIKETLFHQSQLTEMQADGSVLMTLKVNNTGDFHAWIMSWGKDVEVLEPQALRNHMLDVIRSLADIYGAKGILNKPERCAGNLPEMKPIEITDAQWERISPLLPPQPKTGRRRTDDRLVINGILCVFESNFRWNNIPRKYGAYSTCFERFKTWKLQGVWAKICETLTSSELNNVETYWNTILPDSE
jgi:transposase